MQARQHSNIRIATPEDALRIAEMHVASWHETYRGIIPDALLSSLSVERRAESWQQILGDPVNAHDTMVAVANVGSNLVGFGACGAQRTAGLLADGYDGEIGAIYILSAYQRRGLGKALFCAMTRELLRRGYRGVALWVLRDNDRARRFYEWCHGRVISTREEVRGEATLLELAYAWPDLQALNCKVCE